MPADLHRFQRSMRSIRGEYGNRGLTSAEQLRHAVWRNVKQRGGDERGLGYGQMGPQVHATCPNLNTLPRVVLVE